jgi:acetyltransferase-like isoleucine patch superfamily enzyme
MTVIFEGTAAHPAQVHIATTLDNAGNVELDNAVLSVPQLDNGNGVDSQGTSVLTSPAFHNGGSVDAVAGSLTLTDSLAQLSNGTLASGSWGALDNATLVLPGDVTSLNSGMISLGTGSAIEDPAHHTALAGLGSIGPAATLALDGTSLSLTGSLTANGTVELGSYSGSADLTVAGTLTQAHGSLAMANQSTLTARTVTIGQHALLSAGGTLVGNLVNNGSVIAGLSVTGSYTQAASGTLRAGFGPELMVGGKATLAGALTALAVPPPTPGTRSPAITAASVSGGFTSHNPGFNIVGGANEVDVVAQPQIVAATSAIAPGGTLTVNGGDFDLGSNVTVFLDQAGGTVLGAARANVYGEVTVTGNIPSSLPPGTHKLVAVDSSGRRATATVTVS